MKTNEAYRRQGEWICAGLPPDSETKEYVVAPWLRGQFEWDGRGKRATAFIACPGWHEFYVNGQRPDDRALSPAPMQFSRHIPFLVYDVTGLLLPGINEIRVLLGNGWYNPFNADAWKFCQADWRNPRDEPVKLCFDLEVDNRNIFRSTTDWKYQASAIVFNCIRNGEYYDARQEAIREDDWQPVRAATAPLGELCEEQLEPCRIKQEFLPEKITFADPATRTTVYKFPVNLTGWARIKVSGPCGGTVRLRYGERIHPDGTLDQVSISQHIHSGAVQQDHYTLSGNGPETWQPRFTYHGFQYVEAVLSEGVELREIRAAFIYTDFKSSGHIECDNATFNRLQSMTVQSFLSNFTGLPTDCPHREKNGWTGDAQLAAETGVWNFNAGKGYRHFLRIMADTQTPDGLLSSIAPSAAGWGHYFNPAWDMALFEIPYQLYLFEADSRIIEEFYPAMKRYLHYCEIAASGDGLLHDGLGDWCCPDEKKMTPAVITSSGNYYGMLKIMRFFAQVLKLSEDEKLYARLASALQKVFIRQFFHGSGQWGDGSPTATGTALFFGLSPDPQSDAEKLATQMRALRHKAEFGILGAKYIPRMLAEHGFMADARKIFTQPESPGWARWVKQGATTLPEHLVEPSSLNHIMFGDVSAWMYRYLGGLRPMAETPGFKRFVIQPRLVSGVKHVEVEHLCRYGRIKVNWRSHNGVFRLDAVVPAETSARVILPDGREKRVGSGVHKFESSLTAITTEPV